MDIGTVACNRLPHFLFEMERENGLTVHKVGDQFMMSFDSNHETGDFYNEALSAWYYARKKYLEAETNNEEALKKYQLWTLEYPFNIMAEEEKISDQIKELYAKQIASEKKKMKLKTVADFIRIFEDMSHENIDYIITKNNLLSGMLGVCSRIRLSHSMLLELNVASQTAYARFAAAISILQDMKQDMEIQTNSYDNISYDEYNIISSALAPAILGTVKTMHEHFKDGTFTDPDYQLEYQDDLRQFNIPIEDAIHIS